jgi:GT2 family glycosyltransferase
LNNPSKEDHSVFAIVVTFNRPDVLRVCIDSLLTQTEYGLKRIHVVVNSTDDATKVLLQTYNTDLITHEFLNNPGPAGGFNAGLQRFIKEEQSLVWLMDDDVVVEGDCLKELLRHALNEEYIYPTVLTANGKELGSYGWWGLVLSKRIVEKVGLPMTELFYWAEDTEYLQHRIRRVNKIVPFKCKSAVVKHLHIRTEKRPSWYYYYVLRNTLFYRIYILKFSSHHLKRVLYLIYTSIFRILFKEKRKTRKIRLLLLGIYHGLIGKIGKLVDPALNR